MQQMISPPRRGTMINPRASVAGIDAANGQCRANYLLPETKQTLVRLKAECK